MLFLVVYGVPILFGDVSFLRDFYVQATVGLGLVAGAYMAETIRAGIQAVPRGQMEAARTLGMSQRPGDALDRHPAGVPHRHPADDQRTDPAGQGLLAGLRPRRHRELSTSSPSSAQVAASGGISGIPNGPTPLLLAGLFYLVITLPLSQAVRALERRQARRGGH